MGDERDRFKIIPHGNGNKKMSNLACGCFPSRLGGNVVCSNCEQRHRLEMREREQALKERILNTDGLRCKKYYSITYKHNTPYNEEAFAQAYADYLRGEQQCMAKEIFIAGWNSAVSGLKND